jgi:hypothetical protein
MADLNPEDRHNQSEKQAFRGADLERSAPDRRPAQKAKPVSAITFDSAANQTGGNVAVHPIWYDQHIESDTAFLDPTAVQNVPWTITDASPSRTAEWWVFPNLAFEVRI